MLEYDRKKLGQFLKETREDANFTQADVSQKLGYTSPQFISNIERGISVAPLKTLARMVQLYKASPESVVKIILESQRKLLREKLMRSK
jgi:transcriptional regulator with XRE-family HTH domain